MSDTPTDCLCAGIIVADYLCRPIPAWPPPGGLVLTENLEFAIGGCAANVAVDLRKLDLHVGLSGAIGRDAFGNAIAELLKGAQIDDRGLLRSDRLPTSGTMIVNVRGEDRRFIHCVGANAEYDAASITDEVLKQTKVLYVGGYCLMPALTAERVAKLFERAQRLGVVTALDVVLPERGDFWSHVSPVLPFTDYFFPNQDEALRITGLGSALEQAKRFVETGCRTAVVTCGSAGTVLIGRDGRWRIDSHQVEAVDPTGTGDAFVAGFLYGVIRQAGPVKSLEYGTAMGASCVRSLGATTGVFTARELEQFVAEHRLTAKTC
jgi:sugar/nucleoside kinase (ribokinase family)